MADTPKKKRRSAIAREFDPRRWVYPIIALGGFLGAWVLAHAIEDIWAIIWAYYPQSVGRPNPMASNISGIAVALAGTVYAFRRQDWFKFLTEVVTEVSQVTWPTRTEIRSATVVVIVISLICSLILFAMDQVWSSATDLLYGI